VSHRIRKPNRSPEAPLSSVSWDDAHVSPDEGSGASADDFRTMLADPEAREHMATVSRLAEGSDPLLYVVESVDHA
jgi:hypothetical protein